MADVQALDEMQIFHSGIIRIPKSYLYVVQMLTKLEWVSDKQNGFPVYLFIRRKRITFLVQLNS